MTSDELQRLARLIDQRASEVGNALAPEPSSVDGRICDLLGYTMTTPEQASCVARIAAAYRGLDPTSPTIERDAKQIAGIRRGFTLPKALRERLPELCSLQATAPQPKPAPRRDDRPAIERLESAIEAELRKPYREQRQHLIRKWRAELATLDANTHNASHAEA